MSQQMRFATALAQLPGQTEQEPPRPPVAPGNWFAFQITGHAFLAVHIDHGNVHVVDGEGWNYGSYYNTESFVDYWQRDGVSLRLGRAQVRVVPTQGV